jgi:hypothetical protein
MAVIEMSPSPPVSADRYDRSCSANNTIVGIDPVLDDASHRVSIGDYSLLGPVERSAGAVVTGSGVALCPTGSAVAPSVSCACSLNTFVHPQKITLTWQIVKIALRDCDVGIPFAADRHSARTPCRSSRKPRGVVMAHAVRKDIALHQSSRSAKDFQTGPADAIHNYVKAPLMSESIMAQCLLPID